MEPRYHCSDDDRQELRDIQSELYAAITAIDDASRKGNRLQVIELVSDTFSKIDRLGAWQNNMPVGYMIDRLADNEKYTLDRGDGLTLIRDMSGEIVGAQADKGACIKKLIAGSVR